MSSDRFTEAFDTLWSALFSSPVHLDSALSKQAPRLKSLLAPVTSAILLRPVSLAERVGVGMQEGEPWSLPHSSLPSWRAAGLLANRLHGLMSSGLPAGPGSLADFPPSMTGEWSRHWGPDKGRELAELLSTEPPLSLRARRDLGVAALREAIGGDRLPVKSEASAIAPLGLRLAGYAPVLGNEASEKGQFEIQDEGSQLMALFALWPERYSPALSDVPGRFQGKKLPPPPEAAPMTVVDACAGAGGKTLALSDALGGKGRIYAYDVSETKLRALRRRATRAGVQNIQAVTVVEGKEDEVASRFRKRADAVLVDAPCSGWGVLRRNPDIKWRQSADAVARMPGIQLRLLKAYSELVREGGRLTFGVCTFRPEETRDVVKAFLAESPAFEAREGGYLGPGPCDGFFMQSFLRVKG